jgi:hypothetical protein
MTVDLNYLMWKQDQKQFEKTFLLEKRVEGLETKVNDLTNRVLYLVRDAILENQRARILHKGENNETFK